MLDPINAYFCKAPAVICTAGSYIAALNEDVSPSLDRLLFGKWLYELMAPEDVLRYEAHFENGRKGDSFSFHIHPVEGLCCGTAVFGNMMGRRYATIMLSDGEPEAVEMLLHFADSERQLSVTERNIFVKKLLTIPDERFGEADWGELVELESMCENVIRLFCTLDRFSSLSFDSSGFNISCISSVSVGGYLQLASSMLYAINEISSSRHLDMKLFADGKEPLIRVATSVSNSTCEVRGVEGLSELFPTASGFIDICQYVAGVEGCELSGGISSEEREAFLLLRLPKLVSDTVDFRCRRDYNVYVQRLRFITSLLDRMAS